MKDRECVDFLKWMLPRLGLRWAGYRRVRRQVCKRITSRMRTLGLESADDYRHYLGTHPEEWPVADRLCTVTISRFHRDADVFGYLGHTLLPALAARARDAGRSRIQAWSAGCGSGEEPYSLVLVWHFDTSEQTPVSSLDVLATDVDETLLERARAASYPGGCLKELPRGLLSAAFKSDDGSYSLDPSFARNVTFRRHDVRDAAPVTAGFDLALCRNLAFTYFEETVQIEVARRLQEALRPGGALVIGRRERLPAGVAGFAASSAEHGVYRKLAD